MVKSLMEATGVKSGDKAFLVVNGSGATKTFTVRKISGGIGVERIFPFATPMIADVKVNKRGVVRRARIFYLRNLTGKKARIKERRG